MKKELVQFLCTCIIAIILAPFAIIAIQKHYMVAGFNKGIAIVDENAIITQDLHNGLYATATIKTVGYFLKENYGNENDENNLINITIKYPPPPKFVYKSQSSVQSWISSYNHGKISIFIKYNKKNNEYVAFTDPVGIIGWMVLLILCLIPLILLTILMFLKFCLLLVEWFKSQNKYKYNDQVLQNL